MITIFISILVITIVINWYLELLSNKSVEQLIKETAIKDYIKEIEFEISKQVGDKNLIYIKLSLWIIALLFIIFNWLLAIVAILAIVIGTIAAKRLIKVVSVASYLNKIATYINKLD